MKSLISSNLKKVFAISSLLLLLSGCSIKNIGASIFGAEDISSLPDISITSASLSSTDVADTVKLDLVLENKNNQGTEKEFFVSGSWLENPSLSTLIRLSIPGGLAAGQSKTLSQILDLPSLVGKSGNYKFSADRCPQAFCSDLVKESDENNNDLTIHFDL